MALTFTTIRLSPSVAFTVLHTGYNSSSQVSTTATGDADAGSDACQTGLLDADQQ